MSIGFSIRKIRISLHDFLGIGNHLTGNKTFLSGVVYLVTEEGVCLQKRSGDFA